MSEIDPSYVPSSCYTSCDGAYIIAQSAPCDTGSDYTQSRDACLACVEDMGNQTDVTYLESKFSELTGDACDPTSSQPVLTILITSTLTNGPAIPASYLTVYGTYEATVLSASQLNGDAVLTTLYKSINVTSPLPAYSTHLAIESLVSSFIPSDIFSDLAASVSSAAAAATITGNPTSLIYSALEDASPPGWFVSAVPATYTAQMDDLQSSINVLRAASTSATSSAASNSTVQAGSKEWIAGAVVGPIAGLALLFAGVFLLLRRRRRRRALHKGPAQPKPADAEMKFERAQLHADSLSAPPPARLYEMDGQQYSRELPVVEHPRELPAGQGPGELHGGAAGDEISQAS